MNNINPIDNTDTLDEEIQKVLLQNGYSDIRHFNECVAELKTLFTEHSKEVDRLARINELEKYTFGADSLVIQKRIAQLKRNKGEHNAHIS